MDFSKNDVCVLIPTLSDRATIGPAIEERQREGYYRILVVDGHSTDGTLEIAGSLGAIVMIQDGKGKGAAIIKAFENITSPYILMLDGEGTNPPECADTMIEPLASGRTDRVIGNRLNQYEHGALSFFNLWGNLLMNTLFEWTHGVYMADIPPGYRAFTLSSVRRMNLKKTGFEIVPTFYKKCRGSPTKLRPVRDGYKIFRAINGSGKMNNSFSHFNFICVLMSVIAFCL
jgi:dolichol-phosphate mannosyltransferase